MANENCGYTRTGPKYDRIREARRNAYKKWLQKEIQQEMQEMEKAVDFLIGNVEPTNKAIQTNSETITTLSEKVREYHDTIFETLLGEDAPPASS